MFGSDLVWLWMERRLRSLETWLGICAGLSRLLPRTAMAVLGGVVTPFTDAIVKKNFGLVTPAVVDAAWKAAKPEDKKKFAEVVKGLDKVLADAAVVKELKENTPDKEAAAVLMKVD